jgi:hypothetical protein
VLARAEVAVEGEILARTSGVPFPGEIRIGCALVVLATVAAAAVVPLPAGVVVMSDAIVEVAVGVVVMSVAVVAVAVALTWGFES